MGPKTFNMQTQTDFLNQDHDIEKKLFMVERNFEHARMNDTGCLEQRLLRFKKDFERRMQDEKGAEMRRFKEFELSNMRLEEAERYR